MLSFLLPSGRKLWDFALSPRPPSLRRTLDRWHDITGQAGSTMQRSCGPIDLRQGVWGAKRGRRAVGTPDTNSPALWRQAHAGSCTHCAIETDHKWSLVDYPFTVPQSADLHFDVEPGNKALFER